MFFLQNIIIIYLMPILIDEHLEMDQEDLNLDVNYPMRVLKYQKEV